jgi:hypothetical protein
MGKNNKTPELVNSVIEGTPEMDDSEHPLGEHTHTVAWVSRHPPLPAQIDALKSKLGSIDFVPMSDTFSNAKEIYRKVKEVGAEYAVVVLPLSVTMHLLNNPEASDIIWLRAEMVKASGRYDPLTDVLLDDGKGNKRHVRFKKFQVLTAIEVHTEPFEVTDHGSK